uniref:Uncharacterized protein n=1 Tax=Glossina pallidipes TaxID=7398 RepID=A0A1A9Z330_GLOPL
MRKGHYESAEMFACQTNALRLANESSANCATKGAYTSTVDNATHADTNTTARHNTYASVMAIIAVAVRCPVCGQTRHYHPVVISLLRQQTQLGSKDYHRGNHHNDPPNSDEIEAVTAAACHLIAAAFRLKQAIRL